MSVHGDVAPATVGVDLLAEGVQVEYLDGRRTLYRGVPEPRAGRLRTAPDKQVHVLVTDPAGTEGVLVYVNDRKTHDDILDASGVGRILLDPGEEEELFPGVRVRTLPGYRTEVVADPKTARGRVFVFVEDEWGEASYEMVDENADVDTGEDSEDADVGAGEDGNAGAGEDGEDDARTGNGPGGGDPTTGGGGT